MSIIIRLVIFAYHYMLSDTLLDANPTILVHTSVNFILLFDDYIFIYISKLSKQLMLILFKLINVFTRMHLDMIMNVVYFYNWTISYWNPPL